MVIPIDAMTLEDWQRRERGLPPLPKEKVTKPEPELPDIPNRIEFSKVDVDKIKRLLRIAQPERLRNKEGMVFIGYRIELEMQDGTVKAGVAFEGDAIRIRKLPWVRENTDSRIIDVIR